MKNETYDSVRSKINFHVGPRKPLLATVKKRKLMVRPCHTPQQPSKSILQGTSDGGRRSGRQRACWLDNVKEWTTRQLTRRRNRRSSKSTLKNTCKLLLQSKRLFGAQGAKGLLYVHLYKNSCVIYASVTSPPLSPFLGLYMQSTMLCVHRE